MPDRPIPPPVPPREGTSRHRHEEQAPIADRRAKFARKTPQTAEDSARARDFIAGKIDMIRADRGMSDAEKAAAIADLERRLKTV